MTVLPSPLPSPLDVGPWDLPRWVDDAVAWVIGFSWPEADEKQTWDVADRWHIAAARRAGIQAGSGPWPTRQPGAGPDPVSADPERHSGGVAMTAAPLVPLPDLSHAIGRAIEECGRDIEAAKLEAWTELVTFLIELVGMAVAAALTFGAAAPAADALIAATRFAIQQTFRWLDNQLGGKVLPAGPQLTAP